MSWLFCCPPFICAPSSPPSAQLVQGAQRLAELVGELGVRTNELRDVQYDLPAFLSVSAEPVVRPLRLAIAATDEMVDLLERLRAQAEAPDAPLDLLIDVAQADANLAAAQSVYCSLNRVVGIYAGGAIQRQPFVDNLARVQIALRHAGVLANCTD